MNSTVSRSSLRGAALMMVVVILALLLILAVSFTFLMTQQEGTSVASLGGEQTRIITRTGADHAYARLTHRNRLNEFDRWYRTAPSDVTHDDNPFVDWEGEMIVDMLADFEGWGDQQPLFPGLVDGDGNPLFRVEDPRRRVLGMNVVDESGKVNLNAATIGLIGNLTGSSWVTGNETATGMVYEQITLEDASFLDAYDERQDGGNLRGGGYVVIDNQLLSYGSRRGNVLYNCVPNPIYNGADGTNALFHWRSPGREIQAGEYVTTPTAYKIAYRSWLDGSNGTPKLYNSMGDVRRIAEMPRWLPRNVAFAPDVMGARLDGWPEGVDPVTYQWLEENATVIAPTQRFDRGWFYPHVVTWGDMTPMGESGMFVFTILYDDEVAVEPSIYVPFDPRTPNANGRAPWGGIGRGNLVRLRNLDTGQAVLGWVLTSNRGRMNICVRGDHEISQNSAWVIEVAERAAININSANFDTLVALFHGVGPRGQSSGNQPIGRSDAETIASRIMERTRDKLAENEFEDLDDLLQFLTNLSQETTPPINAQQIGIFANMQRYPYARHPGVVTAHIRFDSLDSYMVDAFATRYQPSGGAMARDAFREWVQIGSDNMRTINWYTYELMLNEMRAPQGNILQLHPAGVENSRSMGMVELPYLRYPDTERLKRGWRDDPWVQSTAQNVYNLAQDQNGIIEKFYSNIVPTNSNIQLGAGATGEYGDLEAGMFSFWYRPHWNNLDSNHYIFDVAEQEFSNRMSLLWWGDRRGAYNMAGRNSGLTYRIKDRTLEEAYVELRYEMDAATWRNREWYHMGLNWKGTELSHINLLLDGDSDATGGGQSIKPIVNHTFRDPVSGAWVNRTSTLQEDLEDPRADPMTQFELRIHPDDIDAFPDRGVVVIGDEAIEYTGKSPFALLNIYRGPAAIDPSTNMPIQGTATGARGTVANFHPQGARVTVFGYAEPVQRQWQNQTDVRRPRFPHLPATRGDLQSPMGTDAFKRVSKAGTNDSDYYRPTELGYDAGFPGAGDAALGGDPDHLPLSDYNGMPQRGVVAVMGLAWIGYFPPSSPGLPDVSKSYPNFFDADMDSNTPPTGAAQYPPPLQTRFEYVAYDGIDASGLRVVARYDQNFNRKSANQYWHFLGEYSIDLFPAQPGNQQYTNMVNFWSLGSVVMLVSIDVNDITGYHDRSVVQIDREWFFYNYVWDPLNPNIDLNNNTTTGADDHLITTLLYIDSGPMIGNVLFAAANDNQQMTPWAPWRGAMGTAVNGHAAAVPVVPVFGTTIATGEWDIVTVVEGKNNNKEQHQIRVKRDLGHYFGQFYVNGFTNGRYLCALSDHVRTDYMPNNSNNPYNQGNLCKFPTGELPVELPTSFTFAGPDPRTADAGSQGMGLVHTADFRLFRIPHVHQGQLPRAFGHDPEHPQRRRRHPCEHAAPAEHGRGAHRRGAGCVPWFRGQADHRHRPRHRPDHNLRHLLARRHHTRDPGHGCHRPRGRHTDHEHGLLASRSANHRRRPRAESDSHYPR